MKFFLIFAVLLGCLKADLLDFNTIKASFTQTITNDRNNTITYKGTMYIKKPDNILWEYNTPIKKKIYITKHNITIYEPEIYQAVFLKQKNELDPIKMLQNSKTVSPTKKISNYNNNEITITHNNKTINSIYFTDNIGNANTIKFESYEKNVALNNSLFVFVATDDVDIIRE